MKSETFQRQLLDNNALQPIYIAALRAELANDFARCSILCLHRIADNEGRRHVGLKQGRNNRKSSMLGFKYVLLVGEQYSHGSNWLHPRFTLHAGSTTEARLRSEGYLKPAADPQALH